MTQVILVEPMAPETNVEKVAQVIREASVSRLKDLSGRDDIVLIERSPTPLVYAHWMAMILVSGKKLRLTFKAHFQSEAGKYFAAKAYRTDQGSVTQARAIDFFKEFCNVTAGHLKIVFSQHGAETSVSLPALARGFDEVFYPSPHGSVAKNWQLKSGNETIDCSAHIEVYENFELALDPAARAGSNVASGEVQFL